MKKRPLSSLHFNTLWLGYQTVLLFFQLPIALVKHFPILTYNLLPAPFSLTCKTQKYPTANTSERHEAVLTTSLKNEASFCLISFCLRRDVLLRNYIVWDLRRWWAEWIQPFPRRITYSKRHTQTQFSPQVHRLHSSPFLYHKNRNTVNGVKRGMQIESLVCLKEGERTHAVGGLSQDFLEMFAFCLT